MFAKPPQAAISEYVSESENSKLDSKAICAFLLILYAKKKKGMTKNPGTNACAIFSAVKVGNM